MRVIAPNKEVRIASVWCVTNLAWVERDGMSGHSWSDHSSRIERLRQAGLDQILRRAKVEDTCQDVKHQASAALERFSPAQDRSDPMNS
mmetsp:Transcript_4176/g.8078  ORF Transcript_4176/g.8078 Transcript_4176/m.8078 type:complete len:89 (-) Transcript_4176:1155-1421(-)